MNFLDFFFDYYVQIILGASISYVLGSISFSIIFSRAFGNINILERGSGNPGFTNVIRCVGLMPGILTFICDFLKSALAICSTYLIFKMITYSGMQTMFAVTFCMYVAAIACMLGHIYPCFFGFKGGKAFLTMMSTLVFLDIRVFLIEISIFLIVMLISKIVSLASIVTSIALPFTMFAIKFFVGYLPNINNPDTPYTIPFIIISVLFGFVASIIVIMRHKSNIIRLKRHTEEKITLFKKDKNNLPV